MSAFSEIVLPVPDGPWKIQLSFHGTPTKPKRSTVPANVSFILSSRMMSFQFAFYTSL
jgi:hypothetical protein